MVRTVTPAGKIQRISAAILVDDAMVKTIQGGKATYTRHKRTQDELNKIQQLAQAVIGFDSKRGDTISVQDMPFDTTAAEADLAAPTWIEREGKNLSNYSSLLRPVSLLALFLMAYLFVVRPIQKQALAPGRGPAPAATQPTLPPSPQVEQFAMMEPPQQRSTNQRAHQLKEQTIELIKQKPANTSRAVQAWLREEPS